METIEPVGFLTTWEKPIFSREASGAIVYEVNIWINMVLVLQKAIHLV